MNAQREEIWQKTVREGNTGEEQRDTRGTRRIGRGGKVYNEIQEHGKKQPAAKTDLSALIRAK